MWSHHKSRATTQKGEESTLAGEVVIAIKEKDNVRKR